MFDIAMAPAFQHVALVKFSELFDIFFVYFVLIS